MSERAKHCCTCGRLRGLAQRRGSWGLNCPTVSVPRTGNPEDRPWQIHNDLICNAGVWRNGGSGDDSHICDDCIRIGLRLIKLKVDELLGEIEAGRDKEVELANLTERLAILQFYHDGVVYNANRMQSRLQDLLKLVDSLQLDDPEVIKMARYEATRAPEKSRINETERKVAA